MEEEVKDNMLKLSLLMTDDVNIVLQVSNYERKYTPTDYVMPDYENNIKRFMITARENFRKILEQSWITEKATTTQISDINNTLTLVKNKITELFGN